MRSRNPISIRCLGAVALATGLLATRPAAAQCTHEVWTPDEVSGGGLSLFVIQSTPFGAPPAEQIEVCLAIANFGPGAQTAYANLFAWDESDTTLVFPITDARATFITTPGNATRVLCSITGGNVAEIESDGMIPANQITDMCCFDFAALAPGTCDELPGQGTIISPPNMLPYTKRDRAHVIMEAGGTPVFDDDVSLNGYDGIFTDPISGPACGLLGPELLAPLAFAMARTRRARCRREGVQ
jgi:hypothetical protein